MARLAARLSKADAKELADAVLLEYGPIAHPTGNKIRRLANLGPDDESADFEHEELNWIAMVLQTDELLQSRPESYAGLLAELATILPTAGS